jgi:hypothetical protein
MTSVVSRVLGILTRDRTPELTTHTLLGVLRLNKYEMPEKNIQLWLLNDETNHPESYGNFTRLRSCILETGETFIHI